MTWNFCPNCGHRVYQHGGQGCEHADVRPVDDLMPDLPPKSSTDETCRKCRARTAWGDDWLCDDCRDAIKKLDTRVPCDCLVAHPLLMHQ